MRLAVRLDALHVLRPLLLVAVLAHAEATILLKNNDYNLEQLPDMPAGFGPAIPHTGIEGILVVADPEDGCTRIKPPAVGRKQWVALIARTGRPHTNCTFDFKVRRAEAAGAAAAIVYDDCFEPLIIMSRPAGHPNPGIPAAFVSQKSGIIIKKLMTPGVTIATILPMADEVWTSILMSVASGAFAVGVMLAVFCFIRRHRLRALGARGGLTEALLHGEDEGGMGPAELRALPVVIHEAPQRRRRWPLGPGGAGGGGGAGDGDSGSDSSGGSPRGPKGGGTLKTCAVCLEDYADGEKQRVLPCRHRFHMECIDQWLSARRPLCPICKWDAGQPFPESPEAAAAAQASQPEQPGFLTRRWRRWRWRRSRHRVGGLRGASSLAALQTGAGGGAAAGGRQPDVEAPPDTPHNFPQLHSLRRGASASLPAASGGEISAAPDFGGGGGGGGSRSSDTTRRDVAIDVDGGGGAAAAPPPPGPGGP